MQSLVIIQENQLVISTISIAEGTENQHKNVMELVRNYSDDLEEFGTLAFETRKSGGMPTEFAMLNEQQATYLITLMRNSEVVRQFKKALVKAFFQMRDAIRQTPDEYKRVDVTTQHIRGVTNPNGLDITYTLNLTHFIRKPTAASLELIQRLTGVDLETTEAYQKAANSKKGSTDDHVFDSWFDECCSMEDGAQTLRRELYHSFSDWFVANINQAGPSRYGATRQKMGDWLRAKGIEQAQRRGQNMVYGVVIN